MTEDNGPHELTPLERNILNRYQSRYFDIGFPPLAALRVEKRVETRAGRQVFLDHVGFLKLEDTNLTLGQFDYIDVKSLRAGLTYWVNIQNRKVEYLLITVNGNYHWDGSEEGWIVADPVTGRLS